MVGANWQANQFARHLNQGTMHVRSTSEQLQTNTIGAPDNNNCKWDSQDTALTTTHDAGISAHNRSFSVPYNVHIPQPYLAPGYNPGSQTLQGLPLIAQGQYQRPQVQPTMPGLVASRPTPSLIIPPTAYGPFLSPHLASPPNTPWFTPESSPSPRPNPRFSPDLTSVSYYH